MLPPGRPPSKRPATGETPGHGRHATTLPEAGAPESHVTPSRPTCRMFTTLTLERVISINCEHAQCPWTFDSNAAQGRAALLPDLSPGLSNSAVFCQNRFPVAKLSLYKAHFQSNSANSAAYPIKSYSFSFLRHKTYKHFTFIKMGFPLVQAPRESPFFFIIFCIFIVFLSSPVNENFMYRFPGLEKNRRIFPGRAASRRVPTQESRPLKSS